MPAPDVASFVEPTPDRPLALHLHAKFVTPEQLAGGVVVVIDNLRASVTITAALSAGATHIVPTLTVDDALAVRQRLGAGTLLGGERGGVLIPGFDLDNSPRSYTRARVGGKAVVFTTVNGTAALLLCEKAARVIVGSFVNLSAVCRAIGHDPRPVHLLCCGTREEVGMDDVLPAGAFARELLAMGRAFVSDDSGRLALAAWEHAQRSGIAEWMRHSRGGRGLARVGLLDDLPVCTAIDSIPIVPEFDRTTGRIVTSQSR